MTAWRSLWSFAMSTHHEERGHLMDPPRTSLSFLLWQLVESRREHDWIYNGSIIYIMHYCLKCVHWFHRWSAWDWWGHAHRSLHQSFNQHHCSVKVRIARRAHAFGSKSTPYPCDLRKTTAPMCTSGICSVPKRGWQCLSLMSLQKHLTKPQENSASKRRNFNHWATQPNNSDNIKLTHM